MQKPVSPFCAVFDPNGHRQAFQVQKVAHEARDIFGLAKLTGDLVLHRLGETTAAGSEHRLVKNSGIADHRPGGFNRKEFKFAQQPHTLAQRPRGLSFEMAKKVVRTYPRDQLNIKQPALATCMVYGACERVTDAFLPLGRRIHLIKGSFKVFLCQSS